MNTKKVLFIFPRWSERTLWGNFRYKFPPLGLLTIASCTPSDWEVEFVDENVCPINFETDASVIALSVMTPLAPRAYEIGSAFMARGKAVVMGGIHVSCFPDEALRHCSTVMIGESETAWPQFLADIQAGIAQPCYRSSSYFDLSKAVIPRRDLLKRGHYITCSTVQFSRGCPHDCEFCSVTAFFGKQFRLRPVPDCLAEYATLDDRFVFIVDDNIIANKRVAAETFEGLARTRKWWGSQTPITIADDAVLLKKMAVSGCKSVFIGFESLEQDNLGAMGKGFVRADKHLERVRKIQDQGIGILGSFICGCDHDTEASFDKLYEFILKAKLEAFLLSVLTPFPGTKMTAGLESQGRILSKDWRLYDMNTVVFQPKGFTPDDLQRRYNELNRALYSIPSILKRTIKPRANMLIFVPQNFGFRQAWLKLQAVRGMGAFV